MVFILHLSISLVGIKSNSLITKFAIATGKVRHFSQSMRTKDSDPDVRKYADFLADYNAQLDICFCQKPQLRADIVLA